jgi:hypothetical protein
MSDEDAARLIEFSTRVMNMTDDELLLAIASRARMERALRKINRPEAANSKQKLKKQLAKEARSRGIVPSTVDRYASTRPEVWRQTAALRRLDKKPRLMKEDT